jgi:site-specific DNA recombinase
MSSCAVCYLRSSKDRSDVSIDAQRRALHELAAARGYVIVGEYADAVESGKDDDRPAFQAMMRSLREPTREWAAVLALDTSRIARRRMIAMIFEEQECARRGVKVIYRSVPDSDPMTEMLLRSILQAFDEWHSMHSKAKGLAGMAENVRQGWRAGGRAPRGYRLEHEGTGAIREGLPVTKSRLALGRDAEVMRAYLRARAAGESRTRIMARLGISWPSTTLIGLEQQALTYAGHTVWNMHAERQGGGYGGAKRRPRSDWIIKRGTHPALISDDQAERILAQLERGRVRRSHASAREYLLSGILMTPDGRQWHGDGGESYRVGKGRRVAMARIEPAVLDRLFEDLTSSRAVQEIERRIATLRAHTPDPKEHARVERKIAEIGRNVSRLVDIVASVEDGTPYLRRVTELEGERAALVDSLNAAKAHGRQHATAGKIGPPEIRRMLAAMRADLAEKRGAGLVGEARAAIAEMVDRVEYAEGSNAFTIRYRVTGVSLASPRGFEPRYSP